MSTWVCLGHEPLGEGHFRLAGIDGLEEAMPSGGRPRQLPVRTLVLGVVLALADHRPGHLTRVYRALSLCQSPTSGAFESSVPAVGGDHTLTYRQVERTFSNLIATMDPTPVPSFCGLDDDGRRRHLERVRDGVDREGREGRLAAFCDALTEASIPDGRKTASSSVAVDWTDHASWSRPVDADGFAADADATWGHRRPNTPGTRHEAFFGYYG